MTTFSRLREGNLQTAVFTFGRFNPPTIGHEILVDKVATVAKRNRADAFVFVSSTQDKKKNPLDYKEKIKWMKKMFKVKGQNIFNYSNKKPEGVMQVLSLLHDEGYEHVVMIVGSDRVNQFKKLLPQYNNVEGKPHGFYNFKQIDVESAGERDPDADDAAGMSASKLRSLAVDSDFDAFKTGLPDTLSERDKRSLYQALRKQMKLSVMEKQIKEKLDHVGVPNADIKRPQWKTKKLPSPSKKDSAAQSNAFIGKMMPKQKPVTLPKMDVDESLWIEKVEFEGEVYHVDDKAAKIFEYIKTLPYSSREVDYIKIF